MATLTTTPAEQGSPFADAIRFRQHMGQICRQSAAFLAGTVFATLAAYFFKIYLARVLGAETLGIYVLGTTVTGILAIFGGLGLSQSAVRFVARYRAADDAARLRSFLWQATGTLVFCNVALAGGFLLAGPWIARSLYHTPQLSRYLFLFALIMILGALSGFLGQVLAGYKDVGRRTFILNLVGSPVMMAVTIFLISRGMGLRGFMAGQIVSGSVVICLLVLAIRKRTPVMPSSACAWDGSVRREVLSFSASVFGVGVLEFLLSQADKVLIGVYLDVREVGIYSVSIAIVAFVPILLQSVNQIFSPVIADLHTRNERHLLERLFQTLTKWILAFTLPLATVIILYSAPIMRIFGREFEAGWPVLVIGTIGQLVNCGVGSVGYILLMSGNQRRLLKVQTAMAIGVVALNLWLIPLWGILGAAVATAATNALSNAWYLHEVRRALRISPYNRTYLRLLAPLSATLAALALVKLALASLHPEWVAIVIGTLVAYLVFAVMSFLFGLNADDRIVARAIWSRLGGSTAGAEAPL